MTGPEGNSEFCFPRISVFPETKSRETLRFERFVIKQNKTKANFEKHGEILATTSGHLQLHALITCNSGQHFAGKSELFPFDVIVFAMLPAHGVWRETVSLSDVM